MDSFRNIYLYFDNDDHPSYPRSVSIHKGTIQKIKKKIIINACYYHFTKFRYVKHTSMLRNAPTFRVKHTSDYVGRVKHLTFFQYDQVNLYRFLYVLWVSSRDFMWRRANYYERIWWIYRRTHRKSVTVSNRDRRITSWILSRDSLQFFYIDMGICLSSRTKWRSRHIIISVRRRTRSSSYIGIWRTR